LSNFGGDVGSYMGVGLLKAYDVHRGDYSKLPNVVLIKTMCRLIPVLLIPLLIPDASPADEILTEKEKMMKAWEGEEGGEGGGEEGGRRGGGEGIEMSAGRAGGEGGGENGRRRSGSGSGGSGSGLMGVGGGEGGREGALGLERQTSDFDRLGSPEEMERNSKTTL